MFCHFPVPLTVDQETSLAIQRGMVQTAIAEIVPDAIEIHLRTLEQTGMRPLSTTVASLFRYLHLNKLAPGLWHDALVTLTN